MSLGIEHEISKVNAFSLYNVVHPQIEPISLLKEELDNSC